MLPDEELTQRIIGATIEVHRALGPGLLESVYEESLAVEFEAVGRRFERQEPVAILYRDRKDGEHRLDFLGEARAVVELKAVQNLEPIFFSIIRSYLKATNLVSGRLLNFAAMPLEIKRVGRESSARNRQPPLP